MDIYSMMDEKSKKNLEKIMGGEDFSNAKPMKKKKEKAKKTPTHDNNKRLKHFQEFHFTSGDELINHIKSKKKAYRGGEIGWITIDGKDPNMVVSYQKQESGKMGFSYESLEVFKAYAANLDATKVDGYIDFWHKKPFQKKVDTSNSDSE